MSGDTTMPSVGDRMAIAHANYRSELAEARQRIAELESEVFDFRDSMQKVLDPCPDEQHCSCVPYLRKRIAELENQIDTMLRDGLHDGIFEEGSIGYTTFESVWLQFGKRMQVRAEKAESQLSALEARVKELEATNANIQIRTTKCFLAIKTVSNGRKRFQKELAAIKGGVEIEIERPEKPTISPYNDLAMPTIPFETLGMKHGDKRKFRIIPCSSLENIRRLPEEQKGLEPDIVKMVDENFWDLCYGEKADIEGFVAPEGSFNHVTFSTHDLWFGRGRRARIILCEPEGE